MLFPINGITNLQAKNKINVIGAANQGFQSLTLCANNIINYIWTNPDGLTPQQAFDSLGTSAKSVRSFYNVTINYLNTVKSSTITFVEPSATSNADGTVTVN